MRKLVFGEYWAKPSAFSIDSASAAVVTLRVAEAAGIEDIVPIPSFLAVSRQWPVRHP